MDKSSHRLRHVLYRRFSTHRSEMSGKNFPKTVAVFLNRRLPRGVRLAALLVAFCFLYQSNVLAAVDLKPLLANTTDTEIVLNGSTVYSVTEIRPPINKTLLCNGATIQSGGPILASGAGKTLIIDHCVIQGTGWSLLGAERGGQLVLRNGTSLTGNGSNSCIYVGSSSLDLTGSSIDQCKWGVNMVNSDAGIHGVHIDNTVYGIQNVAGDVTLDGNSDLRNPNTGNPGTGVSVIASDSYPSRPASAIIRDSTFTGFGNAVDIQPTTDKGLLPGTVEITDSTFNNQVWSALSTVDADHILFSSNRVNGAGADGVFLKNSTGVIDDSVVLNSLNTGVTFWGCPDGAVLKNSLISGSAHQGVGVITDVANNRNSRGIQILDNTVKDNALADILVDDASDALIQGNILTGNPGFSVRLHGARSVHIVGDLFYDAYAGLEMKDSAYANGALSIFSLHDDNGALVYNNAMASFSHSDFEDNGIATGDFSMFVNTGAQVALQYSNLGPPGSAGFYNNAGNAVDADHNYWGDPSGPELARDPGGSGAHLDWNPDNGSSVNYQPYLTSRPLETRVNDAFALTKGKTTVWQTNAGMSLSLKGGQNISPVTNGLAGLLRLTGVSTLTNPFPPSGTFNDGVFSIWAEYDLLSRTQSGSLRLQTNGDGSTATLSRLQPDHCWAPVSTIWDSAKSEVVYTPADPRELAGVFALGTALPDEGTLARDLITSYYWDILNRAPETGAVDRWYTGYLNAMSLQVDVRFTFREMARIFFSSPEYASRVTTDEQFIRENYQVFLRRQPSQQELDGWLSGSWNRAQVVSIFAESKEFGAYIQGLFTCHEGLPTRNFVTAMYIGLLDRLVDAGGLSYFEGVMDTAFESNGIAGVRDASVTLGNQIIGSNEFQSSNPTNETYVVRLYRSYLGRFPNTNELTYWVDKLEAGQITPTGMILQFSVAPEFASRLYRYFGSQ